MTGAGRFGLAAFLWELHAELTKPTLARLRRVVARISRAHDGTRNWSSSWTERWSSTPPSVSGAR
ncbi:hypothetical protein BKA01_007937 [Pseudonocardia eucalypti]|uniref:hypothetical protein n=1 Tax=Pseudonocardia eucalypti TaxID=648755 RepID=UPI00160C2E3D|nr:hypothetical protein [Pseudonocardia eucalypti]